MTLRTSGAKTVSMIKRARRSDFTVPTTLTTILSVSGPGRLRGIFGGGASGTITIIIDGQTFTGSIPGSGSWSFVVEGKGITFGNGSSNTSMYFKSSLVIQAYTSTATTLNVIWEA